MRKQNVSSSLKATSHGGGTVVEGGAASGLTALDASAGNLVSPPRRGQTKEGKGRLRNPHDWTVSELAARLVSESRPTNLSDIGSHGLVSDRIPPKSPAAFRRATSDPVPTLDSVSPAGIDRFDVHKTPNPSADVVEGALFTESEFGPAAASYSAVSVMSFSPSGNEVARTDYGRAPPFRGLSLDDLSLLDRTPRKDRLANMLLSTRSGSLRRFSRSPLGFTPLYGVRVSPQPDASDEHDSRPCRVCGGRRMRPCFDCNGQGRFQRVEIQNHVVGGEVCRACRGTGMIDCPACAKELYRKARAAAEVKLEAPGCTKLSTEPLPGAMTPGAESEPLVQMLSEGDATEHGCAGPAAAALMPDVDVATAAWEPALPYLSASKSTTCTTDGHGIVPL